MKFETTQHFDADPDAVLTSFTDPTFHQAMGALGPLSAPEVVPTDDPDRLRLRYLYVGDLPAGAGRFISRGKLSWVQDSRIHRDRRTEEVRILPDHYPHLLEARITIHYVAAGTGSDRLVRGELTVHLPLVGGRVERAIVDGLRDHLDAQAAHAARLFS